MTDIKIDTSLLNSYASRLELAKRRADNLDNRIEGLFNRTGWLGLLSLVYSRTLSFYGTRLSDSSTYLRGTASSFEKIERSLAKIDPLKSVLSASSEKTILSNNEDDASFSDEGGISSGYAFEALSGDFIPYDKDEHSTFAKFLNNELKASDSVLKGESSSEGAFLGFDTAGSVSGAILFGEAGLKSKMSGKYKNTNVKDGLKNFGASTEGKLTGAVAKGKAEGNVGYLHGKAELYALTGAVSGEAKAMIWDGGKFNPSLVLGAKGEASALKGKVEGGFGTDQYGIYGKADGDLLHAEASAQAGVGYIGKDSNGNSMYGATVEANAMASLAQGKVSGGFSLFGIDIEAGLKGYAGAAGVEAGASISTKGVKGNLSGALGLGVGLDISIDWSDATWIGDTVDAVGDFFTGAVDTAAEIGTSLLNGVSSAFVSVGDFLFGW